VHNLTVLILKVQTMSRGIVLLLIAFAVLPACSTPPNPGKEIPAFLLKFPSKSFAYPVGETDYITEQRDRRDLWYNAQDFGENHHLGEDWNKTTGGDTDCGEPVYATADGQIIFAADAGPGWGNAVVIEHTAPDGTKLRSLYGHLQTITKTTGDVKRRDQIGNIGNASGRYKCHLHFEIKWRDCPLWGVAGPGYSDMRHGWIDPSEFIDKTR
jgi:murein DD-endopeptidase MepM/ murein hydrolase activator NlpD